MGHIYQTTNVINGKIYVGASIRKPNKNYLGSGIGIKRAIEKYGRENFKKEVLMIFSSRKEMADAEKFVVDMNFVNRKDTYNLMEGGDVGRKMSKEAKRNISIAQTGKKRRAHSKETRQRMSEVAKGRKVSAETIAKISETKKKNPPSAESRKKMSAAAKMNWAVARDSIRQKMSESAKLRWSQEK